jgi:hypothetical protein
MKPIDHELWRRARAVLGRPVAVVLLPCPWCEQRALAWSGHSDDGAKCLCCSREFESFAALVDKREGEIEAERFDTTKAMVERHDTYRRVRGRVRQVRNG